MKKLLILFLFHFGIFAGCFTVFNETEDSISGELIFEDDTPESFDVTPQQKGKVFYSPDTYHSCPEKKLKAIVINDIKLPFNTSLDQAIISLHGKIDVKKRMIGEPLANVNMCIYVAPSRSAGSFKPFAIKIDTKGPVELSQVKKENNRYVSRTDKC